jgi:CheY-like chemotaxis protein
MSLAPRRIVLAQDDQVTARLMEIALKRTGIPVQIETVYDGGHAISAVEKRPADLLLLDLHLTVKNGFEVLEYVKRHDELRRMPVVMLSSSDQAADARKAYDLHVNAYIRKTTEFVELCLTMEKIVHFWLQTAVSAF